MSMQAFKHQHSHSSRIGRPISIGAISVKPFVNTLCRDEESLPC